MTNDGLAHTANVRFRADDVTGNYYLNSAHWGNASSPARGGGSRWGNCPAKVRNAPIPSLPRLRGKGCSHGIRTAVLALVLLVLAACASPGGVLQRAGTVDVYDMQLQTDLAWSRIKDPLQHEEIWTIDGTALNSLSIFSGIANGQHVFMLGRERSSRPDGPWFRSGMRADEIRDIVVAAMVRQGMINVRTTDLRPQRYGDVDGLRFEFTAVSDAGLIYKGTVAAAQRDGKLDLLLWKAPAEYYYDRDAPAVMKMLDGVRFK